MFFLCFACTDFYEIGPISSSSLKKVLLFLIGVGGILFEERFSREVFVQAKMELLFLIFYFFPKQFCFFKAMRLCFLNSAMIFILNDFDRFLTVIGMEMAWKV